MRRVAVLKSLPTIASRWLGSAKRLMADAEQMSPTPLAKGEQERRGK